MNISVQNRIYITVAVLILSCALLGYFVIYPSLLQVMDTAAKMEETRVGIEKKYLSGQYLRRASQDLEKVKSATVDLVKIFILKDEEYLFVPAFEQMLTEKGFTVANADLSVLDKKQIGFGDALQLSFVVRGDFPTLLKALSTIRTLETFITIDRLDFHPYTITDKATGIQTSTSEMAVTARVYRVDPVKIKTITDDDLTGSGN